MNGESIKRPQAGLAKSFSSLQITKKAKTTSEKLETALLNLFNIGLYNDTGKSNVSYGQGDNGYVFLDSHLIGYSETLNKHVKSIISSINLNGTEDENKKSLESALNQKISLIENKLRELRQGYFFRQDSEQKEVKNILLLDQDLKHSTSLLEQDLDILRFVLRIAMVSNIDFKKLTTEDFTKVLSNNQHNDARSIIKSKSPISGIPQCIVKNIYLFEHILTFGVRSGFDKSLVHIGIGSDFNPNSVKEFNQLDQIRKMDILVRGFCELLKILAHNPGDIEGIGGIQDQKIFHLLIKDILKSGLNLNDLINQLQQNWEKSKKYLSILERQPKTPAESEEISAALKDIKINNSASLDRDKNIVKSKNISRAYSNRKNSSSLLKSLEDHISEIERIKPKGNAVKRLHGEVKRKIDPNSSDIRAWYREAQRNKAIVATMPDLFDNFANIFKEIDVRSSLNDVKHVIQPELKGLEKQLGFPLLSTSVPFGMYRPLDDAFYLKRIKSSAPGQKSSQNKQSSPQSRPRSYSLMHTPRSPSPHAVRSPSLHHLPAAPHAVRPSRSVSLDHLSSPQSVRSTYQHPVRPSRSVSLDR